MKKTHFPFSYRWLSPSLRSMGLVLAVTLPLWWIGRDTLGEAGIALIYLLPVSWSAYRWGQLPGISAALTAALAFNFLFIPPFYTFAIARLEGWLVLAIFVMVALFVVGQIQSAKVEAREATFMYELCSALAEACTPQAVGHILARQLQQLFQASLVRVSYQDKDSSWITGQPTNSEPEGRTDRILPVLTAQGLVGEIQIWRGARRDLPPEDGRLLQNFAGQAARAFERTRGKG
jgi:K+-sensing histidine kinase KdpD